MKDTPKLQRAGIRRRLRWPCILAGLFLAAATLWLGLRNDLVFLAGGGVIEARRSWTLEDKTFYEQNGAVRIVESRQVAFRSEAYRWSMEDARRRLAFYSRMGAETRRRAPDGPDGFIDPRHTLLASALFLLAAAGLSGAAAVRGRQKTPAASEGGAAPVETKKDKSKPVSPRLVGRDDVVRYFFRIYRRQLKAAADAPGKIESLDPEPGNPGRRYRLGIRIGHDWKWRYMTIRPIGEATGSKSQCFYVIYDTHIVVKIPPVPIRDFTDYIRRIRFEAGIVRTLAPRKCIIPNVSVIMAKIHRFDDAALRSEQQLEEDYIRLLERSPGLHHCLQIDNEFAFFMDLSRDDFLSHAMTGPAGDDLNAVMADDARFLEDCRGFEERYGADNTWICLELQGLYRRFDAGLGQVLSESPPQDAPSDRRKQRWFHQRLCEASTPLAGGSDRAVSAAADRLDRIFETPTRAVVSYRLMARRHAREVSFGRTRPMKQALVANLLDLLRWLDHCRIAIRDLKPDNLMVSGDPARYPTFLAARDEFSIGLIDLETAVSCRDAGRGRRRQPQLGGTPAYATPSHFLPNRLLESCYTDVDRVFFLQDWHAVVGIVFAVVSGRRLFSRAAGLFPALIGALTEASSSKESLERVFWTHNALFWKTAREEFQQKCTRYADRLEAVSTDIPDAIAEKMVLFFDRECSEQDRRIRKILDRQEVVRSPKICRDLTTCSHHAVVKALEKSRHAGGKDEHPLQALLELLIPLKKRREHLVRLRSRLDGGREQTAIQDLLALMFERVSSFFSDATPLSPPAAAADPAREKMPVKAVKDATLSYTHIADL